MNAVLVVLFWILLGLFTVLLAGRELREVKK